MRLAEKASRAGSPVSIKVYPGAHHSFDSANPIRFVPERVNENGVGGRGATTGGNAEAWADSIREVKAFFAQHVRDR
jgi:dienelactone hydrolase